MRGSAPGRLFTDYPSRIAAWNYNEHKGFAGMAKPLCIYDTPGSPWMNNLVSYADHKAVVKFFDDALGLLQLASLSDILCLKYRYETS